MAGGGAYLKCVSHVVQSFYSSYVLELFYYYETFRFICFYFFIELSTVFGMIIYVVGCTQSACSYNVESSFVEYRRTCTNVCYRVTVVCEH